jgi:putative Mg2+ transporter-C (MgtC) family protein
MIQVNLLLSTAGKAPDSFATFDPMRLPLGVLTGMGFIGGGAVLRRGGRVSGVTTAATLWLATILGLCFGGGQSGLGLAALALGVVILWALKPLEAKIPQERRGTLSLIVTAAGPEAEEVRAAVEVGGVRTAGWSVASIGRGKTTRRKISCEVRWATRSTDPPIPEFVRHLQERAGVRAVRWNG